MNTVAWVVLRERLAEIKRQTCYAELTLPSQRILEWVFAQQGRTDTILISTVIEECPVASRSVLHASIKLLVEQDFLKSRADPEDNRQRILTLTPKAQKLMERLSSEPLKLTTELGAGRRRSR